MNTKAKLATILRRSGATWVDYSVDVPAGVTSVMPVIYTTNSAGNVITDCRFEQGEGWSPA